MKIFIIAFISVPFASSVFAQEAQPQPAVSSVQVKSTKRKPLILSAGLPAPAPVSSKGIVFDSKQILHANSAPPVPVAYHNTNGVMEKIVGAPDANRKVVPAGGIEPAETSNVSVAPQKQVGTPKNEDSGK